MKFSEEKNASHLWLFGKMQQHVQHVAAEHVWVQQLHFCKTTSMYPYINYSLKLSLPEMCYIFAAIKIMYWLWTWLQRDFLFFVPFVGRFEAFMHSLALSAPPSRGQGQHLFFGQSTNHCVFLSPSPTRKYQNNCMEKYIMNTVRQTMHAENILSSLSGKYWF